MLKLLSIALAVGVAAVLLYAAFKPNSFALSRSALIAAPADRVFALIDDLEITDSVPSQRVTMRLDFSKPMAAHNTVNFTLEPQGANTSVTWAMTGPANYAHNLMTTFFSMDKMVGGQFEAGLASLKALAEKAP
jgi:hypothetical protein